MQVSYFPNKFHDKTTTLILGSFKYIHNGHYELIKKAREFKLPIHMMVIERETDKVDLSVRLQQLANSNIDFVTVVKFDSKFKTINGLDFLKTIKNISGAKEIVVGKDFAFGYKREFTSKNIENAHVLPILKANDKKISTELIQELISLGDVVTIQRICPFALAIKPHVNAQNKITTGMVDGLHAGIYAVFVIQNSVRYYGWLHCDMKKNAELHVPDLQIKNNSYDPEVRIIKLTRKIIMSSNDKIFETDKKEVVTYLNYYD